MRARSSRERETGYIQREREHKQQSHCPCPREKKVIKIYIERRETKVEHFRQKVRVVARSVSCKAH